MKPINRRKLFAAMHAAGRARGVTFEEEPDAGSGSHGSLVFSDRSGCRPLRMVIPYTREISPGVQRAMLAHGMRHALLPSCDDPERNLAKMVCVLFEECLVR